MSFKICRAFGKHKRINGNDTCFASSLKASLKDQKLGGYCTAKIVVLSILDHFLSGTN